MTEISKELTVISAFCQSRETYDAYFLYLNSVKNLERELKILVKVVDEYYKEFKDAEKITKDEFVHYYDRLFPAQVERRAHLDIIHNMYQIEVNVDLMQKLLEDVMERHFASVILGKVIPLVEGGNQGTLVDVYSDIEDYIRKLKNPPRKLQKLAPCELTLEELIALEINYEGLNWHLPVLDTIIGRAKRGTLGLVYAFVDSGKSSFCLAACAHFATQLLGTDDCIVYAGNEEAAAGLALRMTQALLKKSQAQILQDIAGAEAERHEKGIDKIKLYDAIYNLNDVVYLLEEHRPRVMFVDQAVKVDANTSDKEMKAIQKLFNAYRELAKTYETTIIGVAQGRGECEDKKYLDLSDIYGSRVAIQGELDWALGIGRLLDAAYADQRFINIPKNKQGDNHKFVTRFDKHLCIWEEI